MHTVYSLQWWIKMDIFIPSGVFFIVAHQFLALHTDRRHLLSATVSVKFSVVLRGFP